MLGSRESSQETPLIADFFIYYDHSLIRGVVGAPSALYFFHRASLGGPLEISNCRIMALALHVNI